MAATSVTHQFGHAAGDAQRALVPVDTLIMQPRLALRDGESYAQYEARTGMKVEFRAGGGAVVEVQGPEGAAAAGMHWTVHKYRDECGFEHKVQQPLLIRMKKPAKRAPMITEEPKHGVAAFRADVCRQSKPAGHGQHLSPGLMNRLEQKLNRGPLTATEWSLLQQCRKRFG